MNRLVYPGCVTVIAVVTNYIFQSPKLEKIQKTLDGQSLQLKEQALQLKDHSGKPNMLVDGHGNLLLRLKEVEKAHLSLEQKVADVKEGSKMAVEQA